MSAFHVPSYRVTVGPHPSADRLEIAQAGPWTCVVPKGKFDTDEPAVFLPEAAIVPEPLLRAGGMWLEEKGRGMLSGPRGDRVKPVKLRGVLSEGVLLSYDDLVAAGRWGVAVALDRNTVGDFADALGIEKYVPPIPVSMDGKVDPAPPTLRGYTDIENIKHWPNALVPGEPVAVTEKIHGTCGIYHLTPEGEFVVASKGLAGRHLTLRESEGNLYWRAGSQVQLHIEGFLLNWQEEIYRETHERRAVHAYGEVYGPGVQDLHYDRDPGDPGLRLFDLRVGEDYLDYDEFVDVTGVHGMPTVPLLSRGPYVPWADGVAWGNSELGGILEGRVLRPVRERRDPDLGRVILKAINPAYLTRKDGTEYQ